jgi:DNA-binding MarR family transcriptional regulator
MVLAMASPHSPTPGFLVWRLSMKWRAAVDRAVGHLGLTHAQYSLLASLYGMELSGRAPSQRALADQTGLDPIYVSKLARALERSGLITRAADPDDTRAVRLGLTDQGHSTIRAAIGVVHELLDELTEPLGGGRGAGTRRLVNDLQLLLAVPDPTPSPTTPTSPGRTP